MSERTYKRSWKNLLINKQYQLRFTLFMVGISAVLMAALGWWVMRTAGRATDVAQSAARMLCPALPVLTPPSSDTPDTPAPPAPATDPAPSAAGGSGSAAATPSGDDDFEAARHRRNIVVTEDLPDDFAESVAAHWTCVIRHKAKVAGVQQGNDVILYVLLATGVLLVLALAIYGIKTTHKVAGPLYKVTLYFQKMRDGRYDKVWPLRKGDQLVAFYDHFRQAHAGVVSLEKADVERLKAVLEAAEAGGLAGKSPEVDAAIADLKAILERKEKALA